MASLIGGWFARLLGRGPGADALTLRAAAPASLRALAPAAAVPALTTAASNLLLQKTAAGFGLRRPLVGTTGAVAAFELLLPQALAQRLAQRDDPAARAAHQMMLLAAATALCKTGRAALMEVPAAVLARPGVSSQVPTGAWLCLPDLETLPAEVAASLRGRGVRLGVLDALPAQAPPADFVLLQARGGGIDTLLLSSQQWRAARPRLPIVATGLQQLDDVERLLQSGFTLVGGLIDGSGAAAGVAAMPRPLNAGAQRICALLSQLALDAETAAVAQTLRADVALSYRLLRYINSPGMGLRKSVESVDEAVQLLGQRELQRWLNVLLLSVASSRQASRAVQELALARGRLLELLAEGQGDASPQTLFTVGLLSLLETLLQSPLSEALGTLRLSEPVRQALLHQQGPYAPYLALAQALDAGDGARVDALAAPFGGSEAVQVLVEEAWTWAAEVGPGAQDAG